jgi:uncharacterized lipoprotein YajG
MKKEMFLFLGLILVAGCSNNYQTSIAEMKSAAVIPSNSVKNAEAKIELMEKAVKVKPDNYMAKMVLANYRLNLGGKDNYDKAYALFEEISTKSPDADEKKTALHLMELLKANPEKYMKRSAYIKK